MGFHNIWISVIIIAVIMMMLYSKLKDAMFNGLYVFVGAFFFNILVVAGIKTAFLKMIKEKDERISLSTDIIEGMKSIKYLSWEKLFEERIKAIRKREFKYVTWVRSLDGVLAIFWNSISYVLLFAFLVTYIDEGYNLVDSNVFTIIALFNFLTFPMGILPAAIVYIFKAMISMKRINQFLEEKDIESPINYGENGDYEYVNNGTDKEVETDDYFNEVDGNKNN
jgi:ABC-type multidrug transport system fused ATPase/permease subunit